MTIRITKKMGCWIQYQLKLSDITHNVVAEKANRKNRIISDFLRGRKGSEAVPQALCEVLGYSDFDSLIAAMPSDVKTTNYGGTE